MGKAKASQLPPMRDGKEQKNPESRAGSQVGSYSWLPRVGAGTPRDSGRARRGWTQIWQFCAKTDTDTRAQEAFKGKVIDLLYALNAERAREEALQGLGGKQPKGKVKQPAANDNDAARAKPLPKRAASQGPGPVNTRPSGKPGKKAGAR